MEGTENGGSFKSNFFPTEEDSNIYLLEAFERMRRKEQAKSERDDTHERSPLRTLLASKASSNISKTKEDFGWLATTLTTYTLKEFIATVLLQSNSSIAFGLKGQCIHSSF